MAKNPPDQRLVYLALKNVFKGADAQVRKSKKIRDLIQKHQHQSDDRDLIQEHNIENVCIVTRSLLEQQIFESTLKAKIQFPEVFEVSPAQSAEREASEAEAAKTEADAIKDAAEGRQVALNPMEEDENSTIMEVEEKETLFRDCTVEFKKRSFPYATSAVPSLYPVYLPFRTQHQLLVKVQAVLEKACYNFGQRAMKDVLQSEGWDCPESVELNRWPRIFLSNQDKFAKEKVEELGKPFALIVDSMSALRHTAVHRLRVNVNRIEEFLVDSESLANLLQNESCAKTLSWLRRETQMTIGELRRNKDLLESRLADSLKKLAAQRAELDRLEQSAVDDMLKEDQEYQDFAGANLEQVILSPNTVEPSRVLDNGTGSEADFEAGSSDEQWREG